MAELNKEDCTIGISPDGEVAVITVPIKKYADNMPDGAALLFGKIRELEAYLHREFQQIRLKRQQVGVIPVNGTTPIKLA